MQNATLLQQFFDAFNAQDVGTMSGLFSDDIVSVGEPGPCQVSTPCIGKQSALRSVALAPGLSVTVNLCSVSSRLTGGATSAQAWHPLSRPTG
jgi:hypothetical protein